MFFLCCLALAAAEAPFFSDISSEIDLEMGGTWTIPVHTEQGWILAMGQQGDLLAAPLDPASGYVEMTEVFQLSNHGNLSDHSLRVCPDGSYLHLASETSDGSNFIFRYDQNFLLQDTGEISQSLPAHSANDVPAICGVFFQGAAVAEATGVRDYFYAINAQGQPASPIELESAPRMTGAGIMEYNEKLFVISKELGPNLQLASYNKDLALDNRWEIPPISNNIRHYWPSRILPVGDYFLVVSMGRDPTENWSMDTGDLYLAILDQNFSLHQWHQLSFNDTSSGGMRPWMERAEDTLLIGYDKQTSLHLFRIKLNLEAFGIAIDEPEPEEEEEEEEEWHTGLEPEKTTRCGGKSLVVVPGLWFLFGRRKK